MKHSDYIALFREVAERHLDINHSEDEMHFARMVLSRDPYLNSQMQISEFVDNLRNSLHSPCLLVASYEAEYRDNRSDSIEKALFGRMIILQEVSKSDYHGEELALDKTEQIGEECLAYLSVRLLGDVEPGDEQQELDGLGGYLEWNGASNEKLSGISSRNFSGTAFNFYIVHGAEGNVYFNPDKFNLQ